jgi:hypothetical protein
MTAVLIDEHVHEKVFNDRIAELLDVIKIQPDLFLKTGVGQTHFIGQRVMHHSKKMTDL